MKLIDLIETIGKGYDSNGSPAMKSHAAELFAKDGGLQAVVVFPD